MPLTDFGVPVISLGRWRCFLCEDIGNDGWRGFARHYDAHHLAGDD
jgi:hypothetical protein